LRKQRWIVRLKYESPRSTPRLVISTGQSCLQYRESDVTMPHERFRAIRWGGELLQQMQDDRSVLAGMRERANEIAEHYPSDAALREAFEREPTVVPEIWINAIESAGALFQHLRFSPAGNAETRHQMRCAMRHFPLPGSATHWYMHRDWQLGPWLQPDQGRRYCRR
jgi:hypothetical protein